MKCLMAQSGNLIIMDNVVTFEMKDQDDTKSFIVATDINNNVIQLGAYKFEYDITDLYYKIVKWVANPEDKSVFVMPPYEYLEEDYNAGEGQFWIETIKEINTFCTQPENVARSLLKPKE